MKILILATGSIAAQRTRQLCQTLSIKHEVTLCYTKASEKFIEDMNFENEHYIKTIYGPENEISIDNTITHIDLVKQADKVIVAPASFNFINKVKTGIADDLPSLLLSVVDYKNLIICPAMNFQMLKKPNYQESIDYFFRHGAKILNPTYGILASGDFEKGQMVSPKVIIDYLDIATVKTKKIAIISGDFTMTDQNKTVTVKSHIDAQLIKSWIKKNIDIDLIQSCQSEHEFIDYTNVINLDTNYQLSDYINTLDYAKYDKIYMNKNLVTEKIIILGDICKSKIKLLK